MIHARKDYDRIQDPAGLIPVDEPVFLIRGQDLVGPGTVREWADRAAINGAAPHIVEAARKQADAMDAWQKAHDWKVPDMPEAAAR